MPLLAWIAAVLAAWIGLAVPAALLAGRWLRSKYPPDT